MRSELHYEPEPGVLVCSSPDVETHGTDATNPLLVVEIANASLGTDLGDGRRYGRCSHFVIGVKLAPRD